jgi:regulator of protease activity HflC (stomatin/prohibitin superfamily)
MEITATILFVIVALFIARSVRVVPQQTAFVVERLGKYHSTLAPGLNFLVPFVDRLAYKHSLKEVPLDVPSQVCITKDNTQLHGRRHPVLPGDRPDARKLRLVQLHDGHHPAGPDHTALSDRQAWNWTRPSRSGTTINAFVVHALDEAAQNWGVKVLRYEIKDLTPPAEILRSMQAQITAEREKRALIAASEGRRQEQINIATGEREAFIARSEGEKQAEINKAQGEAAAIATVAEASAEAIRKIAAAIQSPGGEQAVQLKVAEKAVDAYAQLAQKNNTMIVPGNMTEVSALIASAMSGDASGVGPSAGTLK